ncbi:MAG TPA: DUF4199 domain-containing protein [Bacteroidetes bacterium]|nr:DUF4199 domain-containing protein [Bacteroidota bacterium]
MKKTIVVFGLISGVIISTFMGISMYLMSCSSGTGDMTRSMIIGFSAMAVAFSFIFVGIKNFRDKRNSGSITFGKAFLIGSLISLIASTLYVLTWGVEFHFFMPDFIDKYSAIQIEQLQAGDLKGTELEEAIKEVEDKNYLYKNNLLFFAFTTYTEILPVGILITLISALILRRETAEPGLSE